jgi:hypothetical protein
MQNKVLWWELNLRPCDSGGPAIPGQAGRCSSVGNRNRRAVGSVPTRGPCAAFFAAVPDQFLKYI